jgi:putative heme iron utilization protein
LTEIVAAQHAPEWSSEPNADHLGTMNLYATQLLLSEETDWRCTGIDPDGLDLQAGTKTLRLNFPDPITTSAASREALKRMADHARSAAHS